MLKELLSLFRSGEPLKEMGGNFTEMLGLSLELVKKAGEVFFRHSVSPEEHTQIRKRDVRVNKLERRIRKQVILHASVQRNSPDLPYCLLLMSLVKDVERIGDYSKDLVDLVALTEEPLPDDELVAQLREIRSAIEADFQAACEVFDSADRERAIDLIRGGRDMVGLCDALIKNIAHSKHPASVTAVLVLGTRFYQRIAGHVLNLLSAVVMPLHKLDYYDEKDIAKAD